jgi:hypothetical protein
LYIIDQQKQIDEHKTKIETIEKNNMKCRFIIFILLFFCLLLFEKCKKEGKCLGIFKFTEEGRNIIPYKGGEQLVFIDSIGDSLNFIVQEPIYYFNDYHIPNSNDYYTGEVCNVLPFHINLGFPFIFESPSTLCFPIIPFKIESHPEIKYDFSGEWNYKSGKLTQLKSGWWSNVTYYDSLSLVNNIFYSLYDLEGWADSPDSTEVIENIYYSFQQGIVGIKTNKGIGTGRTWCLQ